MESLHRQTLPFLLRRMKEDVLKDLPPKITQVIIAFSSASQPTILAEKKMMESQ